MNFNHSSTISSTTNFRSEYSIAPNDETCGDSSYNCTFSRPSRHDIRMMAGLKIFAFILMRVWCKGRKEIKQLKQSIEDLKDICMRSENQMRVYSTLMRVEQSRNSELTAQLKRTLNNLKRKTASYEITAIKLSNLKANKVLLEHELKNRYEEYEVLHEVLSQTKTELFRSMMEQRSLQMELCKSQRCVQSLEIEKNGLIMQICNLKKEHRSIEEQLNVNDNKLIEVKDSVEECQPKLIDTQNFRQIAKFICYRKTKQCKKPVLTTFSFVLGTFPEISKIYLTLCSCFNLVSIARHAATFDKIHIKVNLID
ncbi:uncharacterized protein LOC111676873 isoform X2 [Lucilia cuprina]|uniref:uncharacterized protein LOC111676873 isoform X2 n=1 Tax=Lucilia cuprina TaxID=7375 RepID=UPI001F066E58|nr:uncharacterized protein LOC111676873 isoform X2 [Lucilia cuprina]